MEPRALTSAQNPVAQRFRRITETGRGRREGVFVLEGRHLLEEALRTGWSIEVLLVDRDLWPRVSRDISARISPTSVYTAPRDLLARLGTVPSPEGYLALCPRRPAPRKPPGPGELHLYLDGVQDPANVGMLIRSARAFGLDGVHCGPSTADPFGPTALSRSAGAALHMNPAQVTEAAFLAWASEGGARILAAEAGGAARPPAGPGGPPRVLAVGNEGRGLSPGLRAAACCSVGIPMSSGWDSLNVAVAGSILMVLLARERGDSDRTDGYSATSPAL